MQPTRRGIFTATTLVAVAILLFLIIPYRTGTPTELASPEPRSLDQGIQHQSALINSHRTPVTPRLQVHVNAGGAPVDRAAVWFSALGRVSIPRDATDVVETDSAGYASLPWP